jgi:hypothetical protein
VSSRSSPPDQSAELPLRAQWTSRDSRPNARTDRRGADPAFGDGAEEPMG